MEAPVLIQPIPDQGVNERAAYGPLDLTEYIQAPDGSELHFEAEIEGGSLLPGGMICTYDGIVTGIPAKKTAGSYKFVITASNEAGSVTAEFTLTIVSTHTNQGTQDYADELKKQIWEAIENEQPIPDMSELLGREITEAEIQYLLERWASLTIYDAYNLDTPGVKNEIQLEGASEHYATYDRGCCLVAAPKDLFSHERTLADAIQTVQALAREAIRRDWVVELVGHAKLTRAAWVEIQAIAEQMNKNIDVLNYQPTSNDMRLYQERSRNGLSGLNRE
jgi:Putative Ig domain